MIWKHANNKVGGLEPACRLCTLEITNIYLQWNASTKTEVKAGIRQCVPYVYRCLSPSSFYRQLQIPHLAMTRRESRTKKSSMSLITWHGVVSLTRLYISHSPSRIRFLSHLNHWLSHSECALNPHVHTSSSPFQPPLISTAKTTDLRQENDPFHCEKRVKDQQFLKAKHVFFSH